MTTQLEHPVTEEKRSVAPELHELHPLPPDVVVPDDLSGLDEQPGPPRRRQVRWLRWMTVAAVGLGAVAVTLMVRDSDPAEPGAAVAEQEHDELIAEYYEQVHAREQAAVDTPAFVLTAPDHDQLVAEYYEQVYATQVADEVAVPDHDQLVAEYYEQVYATQVADEVGVQDHDELVAEYYEQLYEKETAEQQ